MCGREGHSHQQTTAYCFINGFRLCEEAMKVEQTARISSIDAIGFFLGA